mgnify:CR=1 FL=1
METLEEKSTLENLADHVKEYFHTSFEIVKLKVIDKSLAIVSQLISGIMLALIFIIAFMFLSIGVAIWISSSLDNPFAGFLIVGGVYLVLAIIISSAKEKLIITPVSNIFIKSIFKEEKEND